MMMIEDRSGDDDNDGDDDNGDDSGDHSDDDNSNSGDNDDSSVVNDENGNEGKNDNDDSNVVTAVDYKGKKPKKQVLRQKKFKCNEALKGVSKKKKGRLSFSCMCLWRTLSRLLTS